MVRWMCGWMSQVVGGWVDVWMVMSVGVLCLGECVNGCAGRWVVVGWVYWMDVLVDGCWLDGWVVGGWWLGGCLDGYFRKCVVFRWFYGWLCR